MIVLSKIHQMLIEGCILSKRDLYYSESNFFANQKQSNEAVEEISVMMGVPRDQLNVCCTSKGLVMGELIIECGGEKIDCSKLDQGTLIPSHAVNSVMKKSKIEFILIIEKEATFLRLVEDKFHLQKRSILLTGKGYFYSFFE